MSHKKSKRQKGCGMCKFYKFKDHGQSIRKPWAELRKLGKSKRVSRHEIGRDDDER